MNKDNLEILDKSIGANGPSMGFGVTIMMFGIVTIFGGIGMGEIIAILVGIILLFCAALLIFSIDCIAIDRTNNRLFLFKEYYVTKKGKHIALNEYESVCLYFEIDRPRHNKGSLGRTQFKTFTPCLVDRQGNKLILKEFGDLNEAKKLQFVIATQTKLRLVKEPIRER